jgi:hypothetical protein
MKWDWYAATLPGVAPMDALDVIQKAMGHAVEEGRRRLGYAQCFNVLNTGGDTVAEVLCGSIGKNQLETHAVATGDNAPQFATVLRGAFPDHSVSRMDAAEDLDDPEAFRMLTETMGAVAANHRVKGLWLTPDDPADGATYYLGGKSSSVTCRCYQKGLKLRKELHPALWSCVSENWTRLEVQIRPKKIGKRMAATLSPEQAWGFSSWSQDLVFQALKLQVEKLQGLGWKPQTDDEKTFDWLCRQYGPLLGRMVQDLGNWECIGLTIGDRIEELARLERMKLS